MDDNNNSSKVDDSQSLDERDAASKARVAAGKLRRERRNKAKELKKKYNEIRNTLDNTADKRELKEQYKAALLDIDTSLESNKSGAGSTIQDDGIDNVESSTDPLEAIYAESQDFYLYAFKVVDNGNGTVSVTTGTVNTETTTGLTPGGKPTELWLKVTFNASGEVTAASVQTANGGTSATQDYRQIATITWDENVPTISQGIKGSQSIASCGATHQWGTLYS